MSPVKTPIDQRLVKALGHPLRMQLLTRLSETVASPTELADELGEPLGNVSYHVRFLADLGCIELVSTTPRRGAVEHHYRAVERPFFSDRDWARLPAQLRRSISARLLDQIWGEVAASVKDGRLDQRKDRHLTRTNLALDQRGWEELSELLLEVLDRALEIQADSADRLAKGDGEATPIGSKLVIIHYENDLDAGVSRGRRPTRRRRGQARRPTG